MYKRRLTFREVLFVSIALSDLLQALLGYTVEIVTTADGYWSFGTLACQLVGFVVTLLGLVSINHLALLALDRYMTVCHPRKTERIHKYRINAIFFALLGWLYALLWAVPPILGWSNYALESVKVRCSVNWKDESLAGKGYVICLFVFGFLTHIITLIFCYYKIHKTLVKLSESNPPLDDTGASPTPKLDPRAERTYSRMVFAMIFSFLIAWLPYAILSLWTTFSPTFQAPIVVELSSALLAKSSTVFNPIIYVFYYKNFRKELGRLCTDYCCGLDESEIMPTEGQEPDGQPEIT
uniref:Opsin-like GPCR n=1 Tax=Tripedalia cystophora TaxID=6141 RepID=A0A481ZM56_TRICY|nr:opsin-like GPCR [Tripedalia cystophora]